MGVKGRSIGEGLGMGHWCWWIVVYSLFLIHPLLFLLSLQISISNMADSSKPFVVTTTLKVTAPSFYNQPKKFASVAPPKPKGGTVVSTGVIGRVGELPPPPPSFCEGMFVFYAHPHNPSNFSTFDFPSTHNLWNKTKKEWGEDWVIKDRLNQGWMRRVYGTWE